MAHDDQGAVIGGKRPLQLFHRGQVEVIGRLVEHACRSARERLSRVRRLVRGARAPRLVRERLFYIRDIGQLERYTAGLEKAGLPEQ
jgi:hypothetical protein